MGKTETGSRHAATMIALDDPGQQELLDADPERLDWETHPIFIDEWQRYPRAWDLVRRSVDRSPTPGRFLLAGSAAPIQAPTHSGAGRIVRLRMRPLSLAERDLEPTTVSLAGLFSGERSTIQGKSKYALADYVREIDLIIENYDGRVVALEIKLARTVSDSDVRHLRWLKQKLGDNFADGAVITTGEHAYRRTDGIAVILAKLLGA